MKVKKSFMKMVFLSIVATMIVQAAGCGTIIYPERRGQTGGEIDPGIAILDAILFIPGILPGVIAFAVDFTTGAIYRPHRKTSTLDLENDSELVAVDLDSEQFDKKALESYVEQQTGLDVNFSNCKMYKIKKDKTTDQYLNSIEFRKREPKKI